MRVNAPGTERGHKSTGRPVYRPPGPVITCDTGATRRPPTSALTSAPPPVTWHRLVPPGSHHRAACARGHSRVSKAPPTLRASGRGRGGPRLAGALARRRDVVVRRRRVLQLIARHRRIGEAGDVVLERLRLIRRRADPHVPRADAPLGGALRFSHALNKV